MKDDNLPRELVWDGAHVSEVALTAIADGQESIVQRDALDHAEACEWCAGRLARAALLSAAVGVGVVGVEAIRPVSSRAPARATDKPLRALALGVAVAVLAALPSLQHFSSLLLDAVAYGRMFRSHGVPALVHNGVALAASQSVGCALTVATLVSSVLLVMMGFAIARTRSRASAEMSAERSMS